MAMAKGNHFKPYNDGSAQTISVVCETLSKYVTKHPQPPPSAYPEAEFEFHESSVTNSTYFFVKSPLPWMSARVFCEGIEGQLAEVETPRENEDLMKQIKENTVMQGSKWWLGAISNQSQWMWTVSQRNLEGIFTDWKPKQNIVDDDFVSSCLVASAEESQGFHWDQQKCTDWNQFICEIPANQSLSASNNDSNFVGVSEEYIGERECQENVHHMDGLVTTVRNCFHLVRLQYTQEKAEEFCREKWNESLADVGGTQKQKFLPVLKRNLGERNQVQMQQMGTNATNGYKCKKWVQFVLQMQKPGANSNCNLIG